MLQFLSFGFVLLAVCSRAVTGNSCGGKCRFYEVCNDTGDCLCPECPGADGMPLCTNRNQTFENECQFHKYVCKVVSRHPKARIPHIDYTGACLPEHPCTADKFEQFPKRMLDWLQIIHNEEKTREFKRVKIANECEQWNFARESLESKFMKLDADANGLLNRSEIHEFQKSLLEVEACSRRFFHNCGHKTNKISLDQWKSCLMLPVEPECSAPGLITEPDTGAEDMVAAVTKTINDAVSGKIDGSSRS